MVKKRSTKTKQFSKSLFRRWGLSRRGAPRAASLVLAGLSGLVGRRAAGQIRLGRSLGHAWKRNCPWGELCLLLTWASWPSLFGRARRWMGLCWKLWLRRGLCLGRRLSRRVRFKFRFGCIRRRVYLLLTLGTWCGHVHPQCSLHLTVQT